MGPLERATAAAAARFGTAPAQARALHGGDLSEVLLLTWADGSRVVAKLGPLVAREARMLSVMRDAGAPAPEVLGCDGDVLFLEALSETQATRGAWQALGAGLRRLHAFRGAGYGWAESYAFGTVTIPNAPCPDWPSFWAERRLVPTAEGLPGDIATRVDRLAGRLPELLPRHPRPALLHGDLWTGNALFGPGDAAHFIDPACYFGHAEVDLAMLHLFGQPGRGFSEGYGATEPGIEARRPIYQLWPALVHMRLFGAGYRGLVERCLNAARS
ncbi:fructosamine kinase family protein [Tropicimonas marinistellae]|uniref:fructosamine kinase family protein n=1 Tax=Tropicimonas marinistellae TaxID=1739787 RepID=UPI00083198B6|nr:fructosamine kinase family protein [Tropicimonas marinistellae]